MHNSEVTVNGSRGIKEACILKNPVKHFPGYMLRILSQKTMAQLSQSLQRIDLRVSEGTVLLFIQANPGIRQSEIGHEINIARANMAPLIGKLEKRGLIRKQAIDGRSYGLFLTNEGEGVTDEVARITHDHEQIIQNSIPEDIRKQFTEALSDMAAKN